MLRSGMAFVRPFENTRPVLGHHVYLAESATVIGDVSLGDESSVWYQTVLRGDVMPIRIGARSNLQDLTMVHGTTDLAGVTLGDEVTVGHRVVLHGCTVHNRVLVGMGAIVLDLAVIESDVVLGAGSLVPPRTRLASGYVYVGAPAKRIRPLNDADRAMIDAGWRSYVDLGKRFGPGQT